MTFNLSTIPDSQTMPIVEEEKCWKAILQKRKDRKQRSPSSSSSSSESSSSRSRSSTNERSKEKHRKRQKKHKERPEDQDKKVAKHNPRAGDPSMSKMQQALDAYERQLRLEAKRKLEEFATQQLPAAGSGEEAMEMWKSVVRKQRLMDRWGHDGYEELKRPGPPPPAPAQLEVPTRNPPPAQQPQQNVAELEKELRKLQDRVRPKKAGDNGVGSKSDRRRSSSRGGKRHKRRGRSRGKKHRDRKHRKKKRRRDSSSSNGSSSSSSSRSSSGSRSRSSSVGTSRDKKSVSKLKERSPPPKKKIKREQTPMQPKPDLVTQKKKEQSPAPPSVEKPLPDEPDGDASSISTVQSDEEIEWCEGGK